MFSQDTTSWTSIICLGAFTIWWQSGRRNVRVWAPTKWGCNADA